MTDRQASKSDEGARLAWARASVASSKGAVRGRWYAVNTRESIRDDTLRGGLIANGTVVERPGLATTSPAGRYALSKYFVSLLNPALLGPAQSAAIAAWQAANLSAGALARVTLLRKGAVESGDGVLVTFPNKETRKLAPGPSSMIMKAVIEEFAPRFLERTGVILVSESGNKIVARDETLAADIGLKIEVDRNLPDAILVDLGPRHPLLVFIEVVATDGPVNPERKAALLKLASDARFAKQHVAFVSAFLDRSAPAFRKNVASLAWGSFAWFASEPEHLTVLFEGGAKPTHKLSGWLQEPS